ncbi:hypothetical protein AVBRAN12640_07090 [Campylobacter sp. RM12640]|uniref:hypothetical protein n=1 Tax=unclassified Campylobacter TaxID=2593542 RepID=UPI001BD9191E|nr:MULTISPECIES: hypothetical protein [unclassified Campylobacter]MBZ7976810.1 hypothetical protein [Campylobacter sp. RM12637]MBZ7982302.1 hypothetical protein [Campylobacter sp. RM12640]MBZ7989544.1 hypothetical protein [Campylobacter sp. RM12635]MBZ8008077.1 hypothetical protein [Campylobacter sp. RM9334]MBT0879387.1 hypothetical protein [Campylobacter sp. 2018MI01]
MYKLVISLIFFNIALCLYFASLDAFYSIQLAFYANLIIPFLSYLSLKKSLPKFQIANTPRFFIQNTNPIYIPKKGIKENFKAIKHYKIFINIYKFLAYVFFIILVLILINNKLFNIIAFFASSFVIILNLLLVRIFK